MFLGLDILFGILAASPILLAIRRERHERKYKACLSNIERLEKELQVGSYNVPSNL